MTGSILVEDLVDRGPDSPGVLRLVMDLVAAGTAMCVQPNHDRTSLRKLNGRDVRMTHGLSEALAQLDALGEKHDSFVAEPRNFLDGLRGRCWLDGGNSSSPMHRQCKPQLTSKTSSTGS